MPPMADGGSQRGYFGRTESPYNQEYMCTSYASGSSSGSGVATAAGFAPIGLGSETVSSGRAPASINGIVGYSPSWGAVPCRGVWPLYPTCDVLTPHTKIVEDMLAVLDVIMADEPTSDGDFWRTQETIQIPKSSEIRPKSFSSLMDPIALKGKRLAVPKCYIGKGTTTAGDAPAFADSIGALWLQAKKDLEALGAKRCHVPGMPEGWIDIERGQRIALGWDNFLRTNDAPNCKTLATVHHKKIRPFYASLDDPRKHTEAQNHVRYADIVEYIRHRPESIHDLPGCAEALRSLEAARKRDLDSWLDEHGCDAIVFPTNGDVPRADAEEVLSSMQHALRDGVKVYTDGDLLRYAYAFETATRHRTSPPLTPSLSSDSLASSIRLEHPPSHAQASNLTVNVVSVNAEAIGDNEVRHVHLEGTCSSSEPSFKVESINVFSNGEPSAAVQLTGNRWTWQGRLEKPQHHEKYPPEGRLPRDQFMIVIEAKALNGRSTAVMRLID
ncbi:hypothetical protein BN1723_006028 [Verticillium longisporum]|uniref:Amidase domain-containing protein n=1 Tax=Verticillium longisporum TaxID=100787 RepID=A0A0G4NCS6_VERLO|nr:hypothetical protein BN1723_006028 [Verticillium longisporum]